MENWMYGRGAVKLNYVIKADYKKLSLNKNICLLNFYGMTLMANTPIIHRD